MRKSMVGSSGGSRIFAQIAGQMRLAAACLLDWQARIGQGAASQSMTEHFRHAPLC
jgi:hypothetical protein